MLRTVNYHDAKRGNGITIVSKPGLHVSPPGLGEFTRSGGFASHAKQGSIV